MDTFASSDRETPFQGATVRAFAFDGDETKFRTWEGKSIALASAKGFLLALTQEPKMKMLTVEEFEYGEVIVGTTSSPTPDVTTSKGGTAATIATTRPTTSSENRQYLARASAWTYLVASCTGKAYALIEHCQGDPAKAWKILQEKYCATDAEENYPDLAESLAACNLNGIQRDPELWFNDLDHLNNRIGKINEKYRLDDLQLKSHMMNSMSSNYASVITKFRGELAETPLRKLQKEVVLQYKQLAKESEKNGKSESVLTATTSRNNFKKFKGNCKHCGKIGHKKAECRSFLKTDSDTKKGSESKNPANKSDVTCYNCQEKGHYANKCTKPKKDRDETSSEMSMFVGVSCFETENTEDVSEMVSESFFDNWDMNSVFEMPETKALTPYFKTDDDVILYDLEAIPDGESTALRTEEYVGAAIRDNSESWLLDSGATCGVTHSKLGMTNLKNSDRKITIGNGDQVQALGQGTVTLNDPNGKTVILDDVYYAPTFSKHIVSLRKLLDDDWKLANADKSEFVLTNPSDCVIRFQRSISDQLYYLAGTRITDVSVLASSTPTATPLDINVAHGLLGHPDTRMVKEMARIQDWTLTGTVKPCGSCALAKARAKAIPKSTLTKATKPGERLFLDISGPFSDSLNQNKYWLRIVDDFSRFAWDCFMPRKSGIQGPLERLLSANRSADKPCVYLRCDNSGENESYVQMVCADFNVILEMTAPNTPQMNGVVERSFETAKTRAFATMYCARFSLETQGLLWPEAINTVTKLGNCLPRKNGSLSPFTLWNGTNGPKNKILEHLQPFGRIAFVTVRTKILGKMEPKSVKCVFIGYASDHSGDVYKFYNPDTKHVILSRDVHQWMEWHGRVNATDDLSLFRDLDILKDTSVILPECNPAPVIPEDAMDSLLDDAAADPIETPTTTSAPVIVPDIVPIVAAPARRMVQISSPAVTRSRTAQTESVHRSDDTMTDLDIEEFIGNASLQSDPQLGVPKDYRELIKLNDPLWMASLHAELENFLRRDAWEFIPRSKLPTQRKPLRCRWIFKEKSDKTKKSRSVVRGYEQIPGVDFMESFSPLATNTTIRIVLATALEMATKHSDWVMDMVDVEAAFLNAKVDTDVFIEMPEGLKEYLNTKGKGKNDHVIKLRRAQYGLVQSPRLWMQTFAKILRDLNLTQCKSDPCLFTLRDNKSTLLVLVVVYCDDCIVTGFEEHVRRIKDGISKTVAITDLGKLKRHLGVDYEFGKDADGNFIRAHMTDYLAGIVRDYESETESTVRGFTTPGAAVTPPLRSTEDDEIIEMERFRSFVGRIMFACGKTEPCISNACRELTSHLTAPNEEHWKSLDHLIGYLKGGTHHGMKMRAPLDRQIVVFVDSDYASDRNDRKSISGHLVTIGGCLVLWQSKKQTGVTLSSTEAEFVAMSTAATEIKFVVSLLTEIHGTAPTMPSILKEDNTGAIFMAKNTAIGQRTKHVDVRHRFVNDMVLNGELFVDHIRSEENPSDAMTKNLPLPLHAKHARVICEGKLGSLYDSTTTEDVNVHDNNRRIPYGVRNNDTVEHCNSATVGRYECQVAEHNV